MVRTKFLAAAATLALAACGQQAQQQTETAPPAPIEQPSMMQAAMSEAEFVQVAANTDAFEIRAAELAAERAAADAVKEFAASAQSDNQATTQELMQLAPTLGLETPTPALDAQHQQRLDTLESLNGEEFDDAYLDQQVEAHENAVRTFQDYAQNGAPGPLRDWAQATLPKLQTQLNEVQSLENAT